MSPLNDLRLFKGDLFDRLEASVREADAPGARRSIAAVHMKERLTPARPPPRAIVFCGPPGAAKRQVMAGLVAACPAYFARVVTHTSRLPKEHEVDGVDYHFSDAPTMRCAHTSISRRRPPCRVFVPAECVKNNCKRSHRGFHT